MATPPRSKTPYTALPPDPFIGFWQRVYNRISPYVTGGLVGLVAVIALIIGGWALSNWMEGRKERSTELLGKALRIADAELLKETDKDSDQSDEIPRFKTAAERSEAVLKTASELEQQFGNTPAALRGQLVRAGVLYDQGKYADAEAQYKKFLDAHPVEQPLIALAQEGVGLCAEARNDLAAALASYQAQQAIGFYKDRAAMNLARVYAKQGDKKKAVDTYKDLLSKLPPQGALRDDIQNHLAALEP